MTSPAARLQRELERALHGGNTTSFAAAGTLELRATA